MSQCVVYSGATKVFYQEVARFKKELGRDWKLRITPARLNKAIEAYNQN